MAAGSESANAARLDEFIARFEEVWRAGERPDLQAFVNEAAGQPDAKSLVEGLVLVDLEWQLRMNAAPPLRLEDYAGRISQLGSVEGLPVYIIEEEYRARHNWGDRPEHGEYQRRFPWLWENLSGALKRVDEEIAREARRQEPNVPDRLGRYTIVRRIGSGGFGIVFQARDDELSRDVAIKVPYRDRVASLVDAEQFLTEARTIAGLDHPSIVPVYDVGQESGIYYVVTKFINGSELNAKIQSGFRSFDEISELVASVADGLHHAHLRGITHSDVKPANILLDTDGKAYITDFGLAVRDTDLRNDMQVAGTPAYMSPEQARGEGHRIDGRTDIYSLGVVLYEMLTGRKPFRGDSTREVWELIKHVEPRPPRQSNDAIPRDLERICLKALSKRIGDRYSTAADMADDLRQWKMRQPETFSERGITVAYPPATTAFNQEARPATARLTLTRRESQPHIVPKGLRAFDATDADFFLELLPGPRNRENLPDNVFFWKSRIEATTPENAFSVGMLYGPSGCGKSSLIKAGVLPRLSHHVETVYIEATPRDTESRLGAAIQKHTPGFSATSSLPEAIALLRKNGMANGRKMFIVIDQFEQWLHAHPSPYGEFLVDALRQCDGVNVQCLLLVRDDFWLSSCRFMEALEIDLVPGQNVAVADLFDKLHATKVLTFFGQAYGRLPGNDAELSPKQLDFVEAAVDGLAQDERIVCLRLALFADLVKGKPWEPATLMQYGGMHGLGVTFLEESFSARMAMPKHRLHEVGARAVLNSLLPDHGTNIRGAMRSREELANVARYDSQSPEFDSLLRILDTELRLITPTDVDDVGRSQQPSGSSDDRRAATAPLAGGPSYQLTHDFLVPSLREWLTRGKRESLRGRAELRLTEYTAIWKDRPVSRSLPPLWAWVNISLLIRPHNWSQQERQMMSVAARFHGLRAAILTLLVILAAWSGHELYGRSRAHTMVEQLFVADFGQVPGILRDLKPYRRWAEPILRDQCAAAERSNHRAKKLRCSLALLANDGSHGEYLIDRLSDVGPRERSVICDALSSRGGQLGANSKTLFNLVLDADADQFQLLMPVVRAQSRQVEPFRQFMKDSSLQDSTLGIQPADEHGTDKQLPSGELVRRIESAGGMVVPQSGFCQTLPFDQALDLINKMRSAHYRPVRLRPFRSREASFAAIAWQRDDRDWRIEVDKSAEEIRSMDEQFQREGFVPDELAGRLDEKNIERYTAVWVQAAPGSTRRVLTVGNTDAAQIAVSVEWARKRYHAIGNHRFLLADGTVRDCTVREYTERTAAEGSYSASDYGNTYPGLVQSDIQVLYLPWDRVSRTDDEVKRLEEQLAAAPESRYALEMLGNQRAARGDYEQAIKDFTKLLNGGARDGDYYGLRAYAQARRGDRAAALADLQKCLEKCRSEFATRVYTLRVYAALAEEQGAVNHLELALRGTTPPAAIQLSDAAATFSVASAAVRNRDAEQSQKYAARAMELFEQAVDRGLARLPYMTRMQVREDADFDAIRLLPEFRRILARRKFDQEYVVAWFNREHTESRTLINMTIADHQKACRKLQEEGFKIAAISVDDVGVDKPNLVAASVWHRPIATRESAARAASRRANALIATYQLGEPDDLWAALKHSSNPDLRSFLVNRLEKCGVEPHGLAARLRVESEVSIRRAILLAIGDYSKPAFDDSLVARIVELHGTDSDPGVHSAAEWVLRRWGVFGNRSPLGETAAQPPAGPSDASGWFANSQQQAFTVVRGPVVFRMGSPPHEVNRENNELLHERRIRHSFAVATTPVTARQYQKFLDANPDGTSIRWTEYSPDDDCPITGANWYQAAEYCNWLSKVEGLEPVFVPDSDGRYGPGMAFHPEGLSRSGYRLPTRAEWEYSARAGTSTAWSFGDAEELLPHYGWFAGNSSERSWPVGSLKPNDLGLFDAHGNVLEWLHWTDDVLVEGRREDHMIPLARTSALCGGSFRRFPRDSRSAFSRAGVVLTTSYTDGGFRVCRTLK